MGSKGRRFKRCNPASTLNRKHLKYRGRYASFQNPDYVTPPLHRCRKGVFSFRQRLFSAFFAETKQRDA